MEANSARGRQQEPTQGRRRENSAGRQPVGEPSAEEEGVGERRRVGMVAASSMAAMAGRATSCRAGVRWETPPSDVRVVALPFIKSLCCYCTELATVVHMTVPHLIRIAFNLVIMLPVHKEVCILNTISE